MKLPSGYKRLIDLLLPGGFQVRRILIVGLTRILFLVLSFLLYFFLAENIPSDIAYRYEISMIASITFIVLLLLPVFDSLTHRMKSIFLSEYLSEDPNVSRIAYKRFNMDSLIKAVFPDMVKISESPSGRLAILTENGTFEIYNYNRGRQKKIQTRKENTPMNKLIQFLLVKKAGVSIAETTDDPEINKDFVDLRSDYILPFLFREKIFGFLALSSIPSSDSLTTLNLLSRQCALVIHNHNLSTQIVENIKYRQEEESAKRIQTTIQTPNPPNIKNLSIEFATNNPNVMLEFFQLDECWYFLILNAGGSTRSAGLIHSYISGSLYSRITRKRINSFAEIKDLLQRTFQKADWTEKYNYMLGKINDNLSLEIIQEGTSFHLISEIFPNLNLVSIGWKNIIESDKYPLVLNFYGNEIMRFYRV